MSEVAEVDTPPAWMEAWLTSQNDPYKFGVEVMGILPYGAANPDGKFQFEKWQDQFLRDFFLDSHGNHTDSPRHSIRAGHGIGKGFILALLAIWFPLTHFDSKGVVTANSQSQLRDNNWPEIRKLASLLPSPLRDQLDIQEERMLIKSSPEMGFVVRRTASAGNPEALQGIHANHVIYLIDEASGIPDIVFEVAQGSLSTHGACAVMFSNPTRPDGFFYDTHHKLRNRWRCIGVSSKDVPRARGHIEDVIQAYGENSNKFRVRVEGLFPVSGDDVVIPLEWVEAAIERDVHVPAFVPIWGVDVARFGDDASALAKRQANKLLEPIKVWKNKDLMQLVGLIHHEYINTHEDLQPKEILVDVIGLGSGVVDRLKELGLPVRGVNVGESRATLDKCMRLRDELWWLAREWFQSKDCTMPRDEYLISELTSPTYDYHSTGRIVVEQKKDMKERSGKSPDGADAFCLTFAGMAHRKQPLRKVRDKTRSAWGA
jgi:phage terminase large subunit